MAREDVGGDVPLDGQDERRRGDDQAMMRTAALVAAAQGGEREALEALFQRYLPRVRQIAALRLGRRLRELVDLDDVVQETLSRAFTGLERFESRTEGSFRNWLARIVEHEIIDRSRRFGAGKRGGGRARRFGDYRSSALSSSLFVGREPTPSEVASARESEERLEKALLGLSDRDRELIALRKLCDMSFEEMAGALGVADHGNVRRAFSRALQRLGVALGMKPERGRNAEERGQP